MAQSVLAKMAVQITANNAEFNASIRGMQAQLTSLQKTLKSVSGSLGLAFGVQSVVSGLEYGIKTIAGFEHSMSEVKAITGATGKEFEDLKKDALDLGAATKFTAKEVSQLQVAYGRLGFSTKEILNATKATLDLAAATGEDLAKSADIAGSTIRAFGLDADQTQRVADVMASSFNKSALGLENFGEAMKYVAPVAASANISLEQTTALLGVLADAGIRGSMAGTSLRKIISDLGQGAGPILAKRLKELAAAGLTGADAMSEVGRTAYASLLILAKNTEKVDLMAEAYRNATGEVAKMAAVMQDDLEGDVTKATSAIEGFILKGGVLTPLLRSLTQETTKYIQSFKDFPALLTEMGRRAFLATGGLFAVDYLKRLEDATKKYKEELEKTNKEIAKRDSMIPKGGVDELSGLPLEGGTPASSAAASAPILRTVDFLKAAIKELENSIGGMSDRGGIKKAQSQIADLTKEMNALLGVTKESVNYSGKIVEDFKRRAEVLEKYLTQIDKLRNYGEIKFPDFAEFSKGFKMPDVEPIRNFFNEFKEINVELTPIVTEFAQTLGEFFADLNNGVGELLPFGDRLKALVGGIMQSVGGALIAIGLGKIAIKLPGPQAIAAGIALVAAGAALSKSANNAKRAINGGGSGSGGSDSVSRAADNQHQQLIQVEVTGKLSGRDLAIVGNKYNYAKGRGGG